MTLADQRPARAGDQALQDAARRLEDLRGRLVVVHDGLLVDGAAEALYEALAPHGRQDAVDLVLMTRGGTATTARRVALLLRELAGRVAILVPHRARSAGTLLCLAADELVLGPLAELGPLDASIAATPTTAAAGPSLLAAEDVRALPALAADWFGLEGSEEAAALLRAVCQQVFVPSLGTLYRATLLVREIALELLATARPELAEPERGAVVDGLLADRHSHEFPLTSADLGALGLPLIAASGPLPDALWAIRRAARERVLHAPATAGPDERWTVVTSRMEEPC